MGKQILVYVLWTFTRFFKYSWEQTSCWHCLSDMLLTWLHTIFIVSAWEHAKEKQPITNLNILLYQTNLNYRCNHQSIQVKFEQNSPDLIHVKYTIPFKNRKNIIWSINTPQKKNKRLHRNVFCLVHCGHSGHCWQLRSKLLILWLINLLKWHQY